MKQIIVLSALLAVAFGYVTQQSRITNDSNKINKLTAVLFPWDVNILSTNATGSEAICLGSIISADWVVTSAQCVDGFVTFKIEHAGITLISVRSVVHPDYVSSKLLNDIALILLPKSLKFYVAMQPISLPAVSDFNTTYANMVARATGIGLDGNFCFAFVRILSNEDCSRVYGTGFITDTKLCTVGYNFDAEGSCDADSGGTLMMLRNGKIILAGIVSFKTNRGFESGVPTGYTRISKYVKWIEQETGIVPRPSF